ncbi:PREDICTED: uncharacterized protein LOC106330483 [Brassica oleracea var. oleracea]|uniref:uncharacterized protein LOC106330483 n=1 Tax=Brassica oleracea var. oleracea TaxID=109376 RepID=UPI0006A7550C|nr:PREDICTED: uncharacterized protein LOC106330483 [Brassica oleracea var. oleracea]
MHIEVDTSGVDDMNLAMQEADLFEAQGKGLSFTWWNNQELTHISKKIDHALINQSWATKFPEGYAEFLEPHQSDHAPCLFHLPSARRRVPKPFKFYNHILDHPQFEETLQRQLLTNPNIQTVVQEHEARAKWQTLAKAEEKFYHQRSRVKWYDLGDRNTTFYHKTVDQRATQNHIHFLTASDGSLVNGIDAIKAHAADYFSGILGSSDMAVSPCTTPELQDLLPFRCSNTQIQALETPVLDDEITRTLFSLPKDKCSGPDGYNVEFMRASWSIVGKDVCEPIKEFFRNGRLLKDLNCTAIVLIPKNLEASALGDYRPISCCNMVYKLISKIIANRIKPILKECISKNQAAFLKGRSLGENVLLASDLIMDYEKAACPRSSMLKVDIRKAIDTVSWDFLSKVLEAQVFLHSVNGELAGFFSSKKGLRKGDSISLYLFIMAMEVLSKLLEKAVGQGAIKVHPKCAEPLISHMLFADDLLVFSDGSRHSLSAFLWNNKAATARGARVAWKDICKPKKEGGLCIRLLEEFEMVFRLKHVWNYFTNPDPLWVDWLKVHVFHRKPFWMMEDNPRLSKAVQSMVQMKDQLVDFLRCQIGNGKSAMFWFDSWNSLGPLIEFFGASGPRQLRIRLSASVADATANGVWNLPSARSEQSVSLQALLTMIPTPTASLDRDQYLWVQVDGNFGSVFSSKVTWERVRTSSPIRPWYKTIWFKEHIPINFFISWLALLRRLPTRDRLRRWGLNVPDTCVLCQVAVETHHHLFFECGFSETIWAYFAAKVWPNPPLDLHSAAAWINMARNNFSPQARCIIKLVFQSSIYLIWKERNLRIFTSTSSTTNTVHSAVDRKIRDQLLSIQPSPRIQPSFLQFFFACTRPL